MHTNLIIIDNFYKDPDKEREYALSLDYKFTGNYPGHRTWNVTLSPSVLGVIGNAIRHSSGEIVMATGSTGAFQYTTAYDRSWIHCDGRGWAGVCYLTPWAPASAGTGIFRHKDTGIYSNPEHDPKTPPNYEFDNPTEMCQLLDQDANDVTKWELLDSVGNVYNRTVLYRQELYHKSLDYFGTNIDDGRLFQTFFLKTEDSI